MDNNRLYSDHLLQDHNFGANDRDSLDNSTKAVLTKDGDLFKLIPLGDIVCYDIDNDATTRMSHLSDPNNLQDHPKIASTQVHHQVHR